MGSTGKPAPIHVAVVQAEPVWLDLDATVSKTCDLISEAAKNNAMLVAFPECWIPGYPVWIWTRPLDFNLSSQYIRNSLKLDSPQMNKIQRCAAENGITVVLGFSENHHNSLYVSQAIIGADGKILCSRRKMKATHMERTIFGDPSTECLDSVAQTAVGKVSALACWEHLQPLLKYHTCSKRHDIHVSAWPPLFRHGGGVDLWSMSAEGGQTLARSYGIEAGSFVLHSTAVISQSAIDVLDIAVGPFGKPGGGTSAIFGPDGRKLSDDLDENTEGLIYADLDLDEIYRVKHFVDICGHYSRPDILWVGVDGEKKECVKYASP